MNYLTEIKQFNEYMPTSSITPTSIVLWYGLMYIFNRSGWQQKLAIPMHTIETQTKLSRVTIYRERTRLCDLGLLEFTPRSEGRPTGLYSLCPLSFQIGTTVEQTSLHKETTSLHCGTTPLHSETTNENSSFQGWFQSETSKSRDTSFNINNKLNNNKENNKRKMEVADKSAPSPMNSQRKREKGSAEKETKKNSLFDPKRWLATLDAPWRELMRQWLDYKAARRQTYKAEIGAAKCLAQLQNLSGNNVRTAQAIIDRSMANNWSGLFALQPSNGSRGQPDYNTPQHGQRIGQIVQPEDEAKRQRILERYRNAGKTHKTE